MADIWLSRPERRFRLTALVSPAKKLLATPPLRRLHSADHEAIGNGERSARLFPSCPPALETILDALRMEERRRTASFRSAPAPYPHHERPRSSHGQDELRALDGQGFPTAVEMG